MLSTQNRSITYGHCRWGYKVQVIADGEVIDEYSVGNCQQESTTVVRPGGPNAVPVRTLAKWSKQTALEMAKQLGLPEESVSHDPDIDRNLQDEHLEAAL